MDVCICSMFRTLKRKKVYVANIYILRVFSSLASRLNGYIYSNGKNLNVALFILMANLLFLGNSAITWCKNYSM